MGRIQTFIRTTIRSAIDFSYYEDVLQAKLSFSLKYLFVLLIILQLVSAVFLSIQLATIFPKLPSYIQNLKQFASNFYPKELVITINNGSVHTNVDEPYYIKFPKELDNSSTKKQMYLLTIDTKAHVEDINKYNTALLLTKNAIVYPDRQQGYKFYSLSDMKGFYFIDKHNYDTILNRLFPYLKYAPAIIVMGIVFVLVFFPILGGSVMFIAKIVYLFITTVFIYLLAKLMKKNIRYGKLYQLSIHALTIPIITSTAVGWINMQLPPLAYTAIFFILTGVILSRINLDKPVTVEKA